MWPLSDDRFRDLLDQVPAVFYADSHEATPRTLYLSSNAEQILGSGAEAHLRDPDLWWRSIHPDDVDSLMQAWTTAYRTLEPYRVDYRYLRPDGRTVWLREHAAPVRDPDGSILHWQGVLLDVTDERTAVDDLRASEQMHRMMLDRLPAFVYVVTDEDSFTNLFQSGDGAAILGYDADDADWQDKGWVDIVHPDDREAMIQAWRRARETGEAFDEEYRQVNAKGETLWVHDHAVLARDDDGNRLHWHGVVIDVTARVAAERAAADAERRFATLEAQLPVVVYAVTDTLVSSVLYMSPNALEILGHPASEYLSGAQPFPEFVHRDDRDATAAAWEAAWREHRRFEAGYRMVRPDGSLVWIRDTAEPVNQDDGSVGFWHGVMLDVTEEHSIREELLASEARRRALIENLPAVVYEMAHDDDRRTLYISAGVEALLGYTYQEWLDQPDIWAELLHPDDRERELAAHDEASASGQAWSREYRLIAADGRTVWVRDVARLVDAPEGPTWQGVFVDISAHKLAEEALHLVREELEQRVAERTADLEEANELMELEVGERRRAEREARESERRLRALLQDLPAIVYKWDTPDRVRTGDEYVSPGVGPMLGYSAEEWREHYLWQERLHPHDRDRVFAAVALTEATGQTFDEEYRYLAKDGRVVWVHDRATLVARHPDGTPAQFRGVLVDVTERKLAEQQAAETEARFRELIEQGPLITYAFRMTGGDTSAFEVEYVSPGMGDLLGYETGSLLGSLDPWLEHLHPDDRDRFTGEIGAALATGVPWDMTFRMLHRDGNVVHLRSRGRCVERDGQGRPCRFVGVISDETVHMERWDSITTELEQRRRVSSAAVVVSWSEEIAEDGTARYVYISPEVTALLGYLPEELMNERQHFGRMVHPDDLAATAEADRRADRDPEGRWDAEYRVLRRDGQVRWVRSSGRRATPLGQSPAVWHGITIDTTALHVSSAPRASDTGARLDGSA
jgi:PAS domain S-box-containing protein